jgi:hypothetical protein
MSAVRALAAADAAGLRLRLLPDGRVGVEGPLPLPPALMADLRRHREDVAHLLALRAAAAGRPAETAASPPPPPPRAESDGWLGSIAQAIRSALADGAIRIADPAGGLCLVRPDGRRTVVAPHIVEQLAAAGLPPPLPGAVATGPPGPDPDAEAERIAERGAIQAKPRLPPLGTAAWAALDQRQAEMVARPARGGAGAAVVLRGRGQPAAAEGGLLLGLQGQTVVVPGPAEGRRHRAGWLLALPELQAAGAAFRNPDREDRDVMTDDEVAAAVAEIRGLLHAGTPGDGFREIDRRVARTTEVRRAVAQEYGRRRGWTLTGHCFHRHRLTGQPSRDRDGYANWEYPRFFDHNFGFLAQRKPAAVVTHPYDVDDEVRAEMQAWAAEHGLVVSFPDFPSWVNPGKTILVEFARPSALGKAAA